MGLVSNIIQLVDVTKGIASIVQEVHKSSSGFTAETERFRMLANTMRKDIDKLTSTISSESLRDDEFRNFVKSLQQQLDVFVVDLDGLKAKDPGAWWQSIPTGIKVWLKRSQIQEHASVVHRMSNQISMHVINVYLPGIDAKIDVLRSHSEQIGTQLLDQMTQLKTLMRRAATEIWTMECCYRL